MKKTETDKNTTEPLPQYDPFKSKPGLTERQQLTPEEEQTLQLFFQLVTDEELKTALDAKKFGHFSKLAMLYDITQWYDEKKFVTKKQYEQLRKHILVKDLKIQAEALENDKTL
jgi:hypothetical protein